MSMVHKMRQHKINYIEPNSIAEELGLEIGDELICVNGNEITDVLDYRFQTQDEEICLLIQKLNGEEWELEIEKDFGEDLGIGFEEGLMDEYKSCRNKCIFCFIDQMPPGMRDTLYFKDDDTRLSFLQGNYVTLTNLSEKDIERICYYKLSPINISVHTTNPELRCKMLNNRFAGNVTEILRRFSDAGIEMNAQIVLCKGYNDGKELDRTIADLEEFVPNILSCSVVPAGLTKYRDNLTKLTPFEPEDIRRVIHQIELWQQHMLFTHNTRFVYASDEWYLKAGIPLPQNEAYEDYYQLDNGVGMVRLLETEVTEYLEIFDELPSAQERNISVATGTLVSDELQKIIQLVCDRFPYLHVTVYPIINEFFGDEITVAGLLTGQDIYKQLSDKILGDELLLPEVMLRSGEDVFLDDMHLSELENALQTRIRIVQSTGSSFVNAILGNNEK